MKKFKSLVALCLAMVMAFSFSVSAFAATPEEAVDNSFVISEDATVVYQDDEMTIVETPVTTSSVTPRSTDYNSVWLDSSSTGSFRVYTSNTGTVGITLKVESSSNNSSAVLSVQKPNGSYFKNDVFLTPGQSGGEVQYTILFASSGSYTIHYSAYTEVGMRIMCWMYK